MIVFAIAGVYAGIKLAAKVVAVVTSIYGSYIFISGITAFFWTECWPSTENLMDATQGDYGWEFFILLVFCAGITVGSAKLQLDHNKEILAKKDDEYIMV